ncbi:FAD-binding oxidoreductase [bacterium]|nr:FAD-binding oxidoreductase [bacterium]MCB2179268.1 FAD-binding oxidoreductase [bacterium]
MDFKIEEVKREIEKQIAGEVRIDAASRVLYSTDASIYQHEPLGVAFPKSVDDLAAIVETCARYRVPVLPRGGGSSLAGQAIGEALVVDVSRYLTQVEEINVEAHTVWVQPGVVLSALNNRLAPHGLKFGPDPASADRATVGGVFGNNATGAHSIQFGMAADHLLQADVVLSDGHSARFNARSLEDWERTALGGDRLGEIARSALEIRQQSADAIKAHWPRTWRNASGYALNYLLPWTATQPPLWEGGTYPPADAGALNLAPLLAGSEGTLGFFSRLQVNLVPLPAQKVLAVIAFEGIDAAADAAPQLLAHAPAAIELVPREILAKARTIPAYAARLTFLEGDPAAILLVEFAGTDKAELVAKARQLGGDVLILEDEKQQRQLWEVRKVGLGLLMYTVGDAKPIPFVEDVAIPVENLGRFVRDFEHVLADFGTRGSFYAHASAGCLHIRPVVNLKRLDGIEQMRGIAQAVVELVLQYGGAFSGEHGDGQARAEWLAQIYGPELTAAFAKLKQAADPDGILNPGKIVNPLPMDRNLRFGPDYRPTPWQPVQDFRAVDGMLGAIEMCNGQGVCRQARGAMCPTFQASQEEMHSTRGRANLLRELISGRQISSVDAEAAAFESLSMCLACKGCKAECPSAVDVAKLKYEFMHHYYQGHSRPLRDYLFGFIGELAQVGRPFAGLVNPVMHSRWGKSLLEGALGISAERTLPGLKRSVPSDVLPVLGGEDVILLSDPYSEYFTPELVSAARRVLTHLGCRVHLLKVVGAGRTKLSKGFLPATVRHAKKLMDAITAVDPEGRFPVVALEPSETSMLTDDILGLLPDDPRVEPLSLRSFSVEEFLLRPTAQGQPRFDASAFAGEGVSLLLHGHCHQKAQPRHPDGYPVGVEATRSLFTQIGCQVEVIQSGCCGMAGAFGYEKEHIALSKQVAALSLLPAIQHKTAEQIVVAPGASCRSQIEDGTDQAALHPVMLLTRLLLGE